MIYLLSYDSPNIGDDFQSFAMAGILRNMGYVGPIGYIKRDALRSPDALSPENCTPPPTGPGHHLILNCFCTRDTLPIHEDVLQVMTPHFLSVFLGEDLLTDPTVIEQLNHYGSVGCRDTTTFNLAKSSGVAHASFVGCPTIHTPPDNIPSLDYILLVDVDPTGILYHETNARFFTNKITPHVYDHLSRQEMCQIRWKMIQVSDLVITSRMHVALPALSANIPTIFIRHNLIAPQRLEGLPLAQHFILAGLPLTAPDPETSEITNYKRRVGENLINILSPILTELASANY